jgi:hypothetical protein
MGDWRAIQYPGVNITFLGQLICREEKRKDGELSLIFHSSGKTKEI